MLSSSYLHIVRAQIDVALGRFDSAVASAEKAKQSDHVNIDISKILNNVRLVARARAQGNELFNQGKFAEACIAYGEGLMYDPSNSVLYCNRAACRSKLGQWERSIDDCNEALKIKPNYTKALLRRAESYEKLERWAESVRDYEVLKNELPGDAKVAEALLQAQLALKKSRGFDTWNVKSGEQIKVITGMDQFHAAITLPGVSVVHFMVASNQHCTEISPFVNVLCNRYPSVNFLKVDVNESPVVSKMENVKAVPTFMIYKNGIKMKEMICPTHQMLEFSVRHYGM
ncbi:uncharacterized protein A4U43_C01F25600 [Asparagus officinalis]|uniref:Thioredoxin domain-containing protein n=2 Tax=Asparagus officinalis TaxID=4686 RepID=A0A5P1FSC9_ASPOF|nr:uncharacterized protein A4U43_C01F25600 [Asparagus officinalis]